MLQTASFSLSHLEALRVSPLHPHFQDNKLFYCQKGLGRSRSHTNSYKLQAGFPGLVDYRHQRGPNYFIVFSDQELIS